jgi:hypothetical protein
MVPHQAAAVGNVGAVVLGAADQDAGDRMQRYALELGDSQPVLSDFQWMPPSMLV